MPKYQIKNRRTGEVICEVEAKSLRQAVEQEIKRDANLADAYLTCAPLRHTDLRDANSTHRRPSGRIRDKRRLTNG